MKDFIKPTLVLALLAGFAGFLLAYVNSATKPVIESMDKEKSNRALQVALPGYEIEAEQKFSDSKGEFTYWTGSKMEDGNTVKGYAFISESQGYSGTVKTMVGFDPDLVIKGIYILKQTETPGLGARCVEVTSKYTFLDFITGKAGADEVKPWFEKQFEGLSLTKPVKIVKKGDWNDSMRDSLVSANEISAITGATITTNAVRRSIEEGFERMKSSVKLQPKIQPAEPLLEGESK